MKILQKLKNILLYAGATKEEYIRVRSDIHKNNYNRLHIFSCISIVFLLFMVIITYLDKSLNFNYQTYLFTMLICIVIFLTDILFAKKRPLLCKTLIYIFISLLMLFAIIVGTVDNAEQTAATFLAFLLVIPLLFVLRPIENIFFITIFDILFIIMSYLVKETSLFQIDMINALIFGSISIIVSSFMMSVTVENFVMKNNLIHLAETDQLTQMQNRTCYERRIHNYPTICEKSLTCIYIDVNGLHELNESKGHKSGDIMLWFIADTLKEQFGHSHTYRIGGDEYVAFSVDTDIETVEKKLKAFTKKLEEKNYYASVGYEIQYINNIDISLLIKSAEDKMYAAKQQFYAKNSTVRYRNIR